MHCVMNRSTDRERPKSDSLASGSLRPSSTMRSSTLMSPVSSTLLLLMSRCTMEGERPWM